MQTWIENHFNAMKRVWELRGWGVVKSYTCLSQKCIYNLRLQLHIQCARGSIISHKSVIGGEVEQAPIKFAY